MSWARPFCLLLVFGVLPLWASSPNITSLLPTGAQRGKEVTLDISGERLQDAEEVICYEPGLKFLGFDTTNSTAVKARFAIAPDAGLGEHHLRLRTATGLSGLVTFFVGELPVVPETEPNSDKSHGQVVSLNSTIEGSIASEDVDCYTVELQKGHQVAAEVEAIRLGRYNFDTRLTVAGPDGKTIADVDDTWLALQDPFTSFIAPNDGRYVFSVREVTYGGNERARYRLHIGTFPRPVSVYPLGGPAGEEVTFRFWSPVGEEFSQKVKLPVTDTERHPLFAKQGEYCSPSPNYIRVSSFPNVLADLANTNREHATESEHPPPLALNGILTRKGSENWFRVPVQNGVALEFNVFARRLRSPLDSVLEVCDSKGKSLSSNDDSAGADSSLKVTPSETNVWVRIRDKLGNGGPDFAYRVEVAEPSPAISVKIPEVARNDTQSRQFISVPRGGRFATLISAKRSNLKSDLDLGAAELPTGMRMQPAHMPTSLDSMPLVFEAAEDAPLGARLIDLTATGTNGSGSITGHFHQEAELVQGPPNNVSYYATTVDKLCVAVVKEAPFKLRIEPPQVPLVQGGSMKLGIHVDRVADFDQPIEIKMVWNPPGVSSDSEITIPKGETNAFYQLNANSSADAKDSEIVVLGMALVDGGKLFVSSQLATLSVASPFVTGKIETTWLNPGKSTKLNVGLQQSKPFAGKATIRLVGLPEKVTAEPREFTKDDTEVVFELQADPACPVGSHKNLFCAVELEQDGHKIPHNIATGGILRIVPEKKRDVKVAAAGVKQ